VAAPCHEIHTPPCTGEKFYCYLAQSHIHLNAMDLYYLSRKYKRILTDHNIPSAKHSNYWRIVRKNLADKHNML
jgi:hypothetical protein